MKKIGRLIYVRNGDGMFNKKGPIKHTVEVNIYYQEYRERIEINVIGGQKWNVILGIPWLAHHSPEIDWRTGEVKIMRYSEECKKAVETKVGKIRVGKTKRKRKEEKSRKKERTERTEKEKKKEKTKEEENNGSKEGSRGEGNLG